VLPNFLVIGAAKSGTTSLYHYLAQHPEIYMSPVKEPRFFALEGHPLDFPGPGGHWVRAETRTTLDGYERLFDGVRGERAVGEASVIYLIHPRAAEAIAARIPDARLVAVLRDPAERAYSAFLDQSLAGYETCETFEAALAAEPQRVADGWYWWWHYREHGYYHRHLSRYYERFDPEQIRVYLYEDYAGDPHAVLADMFGFLGVDDGFRVDVATRHNRSGRARSPRVQALLGYPHPAKEALKKVVPERFGHRVISILLEKNLERPPMRPETRAELVAGYAEDIGRLEGLIGRDLSTWLHA